MCDRRIFLGAVFGVIVAIPILTLAGGRRSDTHGPAVPECGGALKAIAVQYVRAASEICSTAYREFLPRLPAEVTVYVICPDDVDFDDFKSKIGACSCKLVPVITYHPQTCWSHDRWVTVVPAKTAGRFKLCLPRSEASADSWPERLGDARTGEDLARARPALFASERQSLLFDGGDFVSDNETAFVAQAVLRRNLQVTVQSRDELQQQLAALLGKHVILLEDVPEHHVGMYLMLAPGRIAVVGDPSLARALLPGAAPPLCPCGDDFSPETQRLFDNAAAQCEAAGYQVVRIPTVPGKDSRTFITFVNVVQDNRRARPIVYMPAYQNAEALVAAASQVWDRLGYEVRRVDCTNLYVHGGVLNCLVNVLQRE